MKFITKCNIDRNLLIEMLCDIVLIKNTKEYKQMWVVMHVMSFARGYNLP
jgi:hypothetical protein